MSRPAAFLISWLMAVAPLLQAQEPVSFVSCPVYRDTQAGRKSGCWLADDRATGARYDISTSPTKPDWNFAVLVEGRLSGSGENPCGGEVLEPVRVSILTESCTRATLPAEGFPGRPFVLPERNVSPLSAARKPPPGPYASRTFHIFFDFDRDFIIYQFGDYLLDQAITWIRAARPERIVVTGYAATRARNISGRALAENPGIGRRRAEKLTEALIRLGVAADRIETRWQSDPEPVDVEGADGLPGASLRRVEIRAVAPVGAPPIPALSATGVERP